MWLSTSSVVKEGVIVVHVSASGSFLSVAVFFKFVNPNVQSASLRRGDTLFSKFDGLSGYERSPLSVSCSFNC